MRGASSAHLAGAAERAPWLALPSHEMAWEIAGQLGPLSEPGVDGSGWLWELHRGEGQGFEARRVFVEISGSALASSNMPSTATVAAIESEGRTEVERVAQMDDPPRVIKCSTHGIRDVFPEELS